MGADAAFRGVDDVSAGFSHLHPSMRAIAEESNESRVHRIRSDRWVTYARAEGVLAAMEDLLTFPKRTRMPNLLLVGPTNNGKTMIVEKFRRAHPPLAANATEDGAAGIPVLRVQMSTGPDEPRFFGAILKQLGFLDMVSDRVAKRQEAAVRLMQETNVRLLIIDDVHNLLSGSRVAQRRLLNLLRWLGNELQIPLIAVGTAEALRAVQSDDQLANRFEPVGLPPWRALLPLCRPSHLVRPALAGKILSAAEGILGEVVALVTRAAVHAVKSGTEAITAKVIDDIGFVSPSQRRRVAV